MKTTLIRTIVVLAAAAALSAGCGYALAGRGSSLPASIRIIGIPDITNLSTVPDIDRTLGESLRREFQNRGRYTIQPQATGVDAVLTCTITGVSQIPIAFVNGQANRIQIQVAANIEFKDKDGKVLWSNPSFLAHEQYDITTSNVPNDPAATFSQDANALDRLAKSFATSVVASILEAF